MGKRTTRICELRRRRLSKVLLWDSKGKDAKKEKKNLKREHEFVSHETKHLPSNVMS